MTVAWFAIVPSTVPSGRTRNTTVVEALLASVPPTVALAPVPSRTRTVRDAAMYSPWSSAVASVLAPALAPVVTLSDPGTNVSPLASTSLSTTSVAVSKPVLITVIVYSSMSLASTAPPGWLVRLATVLLLVDRSGRVVATEVTKPPSANESWSVDTLTVALVWPCETLLVTSMTSMSMPLMLLAVPVSCGRSPAFDTAAPRYERELLKKSVAGLIASETTEPFHDSESLLPRSSPRYAIAATLAS